MPAWLNRGDKSKLRCLAVTPPPTSKSSLRPTNSSILRTPSSAITSLVSSAIKVNKCLTMSTVPRKWWSRSCWFWVATPVAQLLRWQMRKYLHPNATIGKVPKPKLSAPNMAAFTTSTPVLRPPSVCTLTLPRTPLPRKDWWASARPNSQGDPA